MVRTIALILLLVAIFSGVVAFVVLGEAWLLQKVFAAELWQIALVILGSMALILYVGVQFFTAASMVSLTSDEDDEDDQVQDETIGPPPWRRSPTSRPQSKSKRHR